MVNYSYQPIEFQHDNMKEKWFKPQIDNKLLKDCKTKGYFSENNINFHDLNYEF